MVRRSTKGVTVGNVMIGGGARISVQSMTNTDTHNAQATIEQIVALKNAGCDIVRIAVPDIEAAETVKYIKSRIPDIPLVADIHFDYRIALKCAEYGVDKIRINPGNIGDEERVRAVCAACRERKIPIRIGVNGGSLEKHLLEKYGAPTPEALFESAEGHIRLLNKFDFDDIVISVKSSDVSSAIAACRYVAERCIYPLHIGVTEAGSSRMGIIKNAAALGALIGSGIGDTVRISLTEDPTEEVRAAKDILRALGCEGHEGMDVVSCPTCGRTKIDLVPLVAAFEAAARTEGLTHLPIKVALMGCVVNGPGEAREADVGIAGGKGEALLFAHGETIKKINEDEIIPTLISYIKENFLK
ncbi:MAG: flavodoxin-dependent (E)-4-hydroxy-3-methylbut-2-enyl-diphosphate synthase [Clostridia bacterium]|nr:flavodoxin-dependent (E)-4-hydroxy-3-methylbut-2-enyl-diphosphate synthase [Clostridia bacterium]